LTAIQKNIKFERNFILAVVLLIIVIAPDAFAEILFLKSGQEIEVEKTWREGDQIFFIFHGIKADIAKSKVSRIDRTPEIRKRKASDLEKIDGDATKDIPPASSPETIPSAQTSLMRKDGFRDLQWGVHVNEVDGLEMKPAFSSQEETIEYVRPDDTLQIGDAVLASITYTFWRNRLYTVTVWTVDEKNYNALRKVVFEQFGKGRQPDQSLEKYLWSSTATDMMLEYDKVGQLGMLWLRSGEIDRKQKLKKLYSHGALLKWMKSRK
jgi:hypothetical protein